MRLYCPKCTCLFICSWPILFLILRKTIIRSTSITFLLTTRYRKIDKIFAVKFKVKHFSNGDRQVLVSYWMFVSHIFSFLCTGILRPLLMETCTVIEFQLHRMLRELNLDGVVRCVLFETAKVCECLLIRRET